MPDYDDKEEANEEEPPKKKKKGGFQKCTICSIKTSHLRRHTLINHLPYITFPFTACMICHLQLGQNPLLRKHVETYHQGKGTFNLQEHGHTLLQRLTVLLDHLATHLHLKSWRHLFTSIKENVHLHPSSRSEINPEEAELMNAFCNYHHISGPSEFTLSPPNSPSCLLHWRVLLSIISTVTSHSQENIAKFDTLQPVISDAHFHLDRLCEVTGTSGLPQTTVSSRSGVSVKLQHAIANFVFPSSWPSSSHRSSMRKDNRLHFTYGIHPRVAASYYHKGKSTNDLLNSLWSLLQTTRTVGVGECGFDETETCETLGYQISVFTSQCKFAKLLHLPIIIHARGKDALSKCRIHARSYLLPGHPIQLHCFNSTKQDIDEWLESFPNTMFSISPLIFKSSKLREAITYIPLDHLLIETDAPYLDITPSSSGKLTGRPSLCYDIATEISSLTSIPVQVILQASCRNILKIFKIMP